MNEFLISDILNRQFVGLPMGTMQIAIFIAGSFRYEFPEKQGRPNDRLPFDHPVPAL